MKTIFKKIAESERFDDVLNIIKNENENLPINEWINKYRNMFDPYYLIEWILDDEFISEKNQRLFAIWCAKQTLKIARDKSEVIGVLEVAERFANGEATIYELKEAYDTAINASYGYQYIPNDEFNNKYADVALYIRGAVAAATKPYTSRENSFYYEAAYASECFADAYDYNYYMINGCYDNGETSDLIYNEQINKYLTLF
jgi:hypothetical protein